MVQEDGVAIGIDARVIDLASLELTNAIETIAESIAQANQLNASRELGVR
jgi:hypothetical protein